MLPKVVNTIYGRFYEVVEGVFFPSVSTITTFGTPLSFGVLKYIIKESDGDYEKYLNNKSEALRVGSLSHDYAERILCGEEIVIERDPSVQRAIISFTEWYNKYQPKVIATEQVLFNTVFKKGSYLLPIAGRCDLVAEIKNKKGEDELWMLDYKTSKNPRDPRNQIQLTIYAWLWNLNNERKIDRLGIVALKKDFAGSRPGATTRYMIEYQYNEELAMSAYYIFNKFYEAYDRKGNPKIKAKLATKFKLGHYE